MAKERVEFPAFAKRGTRKGVVPQTKVYKLVTIRNVETGERKRLPKNIAEKQVETGKWKFCPKKVN